jgi:stearoyl-CoA desaturase (delta-9 desaturase)
MMAPVHRLTAEPDTATEGEVTLAPVKVIWTGGLIFVFLALAPFHTTLLAIIIGLLLTYITLLFGHSVGMHRMMIHRSFRTKPWLRYLLIYLGTLVGIGGPSAVIHTHDIRDWAQRAENCHDFFSHRRGYLRDLSWQLFYQFKFKTPPNVAIEPGLKNDLFIQHLDRFWRWHQLGLAILLFLLGGLPFVVWGLCFRIAISIIGHWTVTYICHNPGPGKWDVIKAGVQASNLNLPAWFGGWLTHGECWHNNHHAFPESARIGLYKGQIDPAAWIIEKLERVGLAYDVGTPRESISDLRLRAPLPKS